MLKNLKVEKAMRILQNSVVWRLTKGFESPTFDIAWTCYIFFGTCKMGDFIVNCDAIILLDDWMVTFHIKLNDMNRSDDRIFSVWRTVSHQSSSKQREIQVKGWKRQVFSWWSGRLLEACRFVGPFAADGERKPLGPLVSPFPGIGSGLDQTQRNGFCTLPETNNWHLKTDGWKRIVSFLGMAQPGRVRTVSC